MPDIDGITIAKELKERNEKVVIFFVTAFDEYQDEAMDLHAFRFFEKPFDVQRLYASLDKALQYIDKTYIDLFLSVIFRPSCFFLFVSAIFQAGK